MRLTLKQHITRNLINIPGWQTKRKIVVIESDDWGSIRMPSPEIYYKLLKDGYRPDSDPYMKYDSLASEKDLISLFDILSSVKDKNGNPARLTANCVVANPDFKKIKENNFKEYFYEPFTETLKRYPNHQNSFQLWEEGINHKLFYPQFHGREHLNVARWLIGLQAGDKMLHQAFNYEMISISSIPSSMRYSYMEALDFFTENEKMKKNEILKEGLELFETFFGIKSKSFIANCYIWHSDLEYLLKTCGVEFIQGIHFQMTPILSETGHKFKRTFHFTGEKNNKGQNYIVRNAYFEPSNNPFIDSVNECLTQIEVAFRWYKPAVISSHRLNFIGFIDQNNATKNLISFQKLLKEIVKRWPNVEFMTSEQLGKLIKESTQK